ncbi:hypothetical protein FACS1894172_14370 [Spirochaetia bacterium]|nr:hypothetical protein FACS1894172_14370 [Spirochaetia bacterium]
MSGILVVPTLEKGRGGGHLVRSVLLVRELREQNRDAFLFATPGVIFPVDNNPEWCLSDLDSLHKHSWDFVVIDRFKTTRQEFKFWKTVAPIIGIDESGPCRNECDFLIDLLPNLPGTLTPNLTAPWMLPLPKNRRDSFFSRKELEPFQILVSFGLEDPARLSLPVTIALAQNAGTAISVVIAGLKPRDSDFASQPMIKILGVIPNLREHLAEYDLVVTHFGLTAFEAIHARVPVMLISPTRYHEKLAQNAGFFTARVQKMIPITNNILALVQRRSEEVSLRFNLESPDSLASLLAGIRISRPAACPACGDRSSHRVLARFSSRTYRCCKSCGLIYQSRLNSPPVEYTKDYFFDLYQKQYGKTYLEDFPHLVTMGKERLQRISSYNSGKKLLDIGCAYGPFLAAAQESGLSPVGIDPAEDAVRYVNEELKIPAIHGLFPSPQLFALAPFDIITLWYVIEHFEYPKEILQEIHYLLKPGGLLAFSTPSCSGISRRVSMQQFLHNSPADHWTIWDPNHVATILGRAGFSVKKIHITGHHPERFPVFGSMGISKIFGLGDTFEVYAVKS